jgi:hypothetical protein
VKPLTFRTVRERCRCDYCRINRIDRVVGYVASDREVEPREVAMLNELIHDRLRSRAGV